MIPHGLLAQERILARVELKGSPATYALPVQAMLQDSQGSDYLLVFATETRLNQAA